MDLIIYSEEWFINLERIFIASSLYNLLLDYIN